MSNAEQHINTISLGFRDALIDVYEKALSPPTDAEIEAALIAWYPGEWEPDDDTRDTFKSLPEDFKVKSRAEMRAAIEAFLNMRRAD